jgi:hypothetical protein
MLIALNDFLISDYFTPSRKACLPVETRLEIAMWILIFAA